jgi:hypothetical protein
LKIIEEIETEEVTSFAEIMPVTPPCFILMKNCVQPPSNVAGHQDSLNGLKQDPL